MNVIIHTVTRPNTLIRDLIKGAKERVSPKGKIVVRNPSPLADPRSFEALPTDFLSTFYSQPETASIRTAVELGCLDHSFLPNVPGTISLAVDQRQEGLVLVRRRSPHVTTIRANIRALPFADESFDLVYWNKEMLYFLGQYSKEYNAYTDDLLTGETETKVDKALMDIYRIMKPGRYFLETRPLRDTWALPLRFNKVGAHFRELHYILLGDQNLAAMFFVK